ALPARDDLHQEVPVSVRAAILLIDAVIPAEIEHLSRLRNTVADDEAATQLNSPGKLRYMNVDSVETLAGRDRHDARFVRFCRTRIIQPPERRSRTHFSVTVGDDSVAPRWHLFEQIRTVWFAAVEDS